MARKNQDQNASAAVETSAKGKRGRKKLPDDPREAFMATVTGPTGRVQRVIQSLETLGKVSSGRYDYDGEHVDAIENAVMEAVEDCFRRLRTRPPAAVKGGGFGF